MASVKIAVLALLLVSLQAKLVWSDDFDFLDYEKWRHDITLAGGGNW
jgi:hypothetical protein